MTTPVPRWSATVQDVAPGDWSRRAASNVRAERARLGINASDVAAHLGISRSAYSERERVEPIVAFDVEEVGRVAEFFAVASGESPTDVARRLYPS